MVAVGFTGCAKSRDLVAADFSLRIEDAVLDSIYATYPQDPHGKVATTKKEKISERSFTGRVNH